MNHFSRPVSLILISVLLHSCVEKSSLPVVITSDVTEITTTSAVIGGAIKSDGGVPVLSMGACWDTIEDPTIESNKTIVPAASNTFKSNIEGLSPKTRYYLRAFATNKTGTAYGESVTFTTLGKIPSSINLSVTCLTADSAILNSIVHPNDLSTSVTFEWGTTINYGNTISASQNPVNGNSPVSVTAKIKDLLPGTTYHFRVKAENSLGVFYTTDMAFKTAGGIPSVILQTVSNAAINGIVLNSTVNPNNLSTTAAFEWGKTADYGNTTANQDLGNCNIDVNISAVLAGLDTGTLYHYRIRATNEMGTTYGTDMTFKTLGEKPEIKAIGANGITSNSAVLTGLVNPNYLPTTVFFEYGPTTSYGNTIVAVQSPLDGSSQVNVSANISGLLPGTTYYYVRIKAVNSRGTTYSGNISFATQEFEWVHSDDFPGSARCSPLSFTYNGIGYYGLGKNSISGENLHDFWKYDPVSSAWTRLQDCPYTFVSGPSARCMVGSILYVFKEWSLYSYNINSGTWQFLCNTSVSLFSAAAFAVNNRPFFFIKGNAELYEYNTSTNTLIRKNATISNYQNWNLNEIFVINNEAYLLHKNNAFIEIYHYISQADTWEKKLEKEFSNRAFETASFVVTMGNCAFVGQSTSFVLYGNDDNAEVNPDMPSSNVWKFDAVKNTFQQVEGLPGEFRAQAGSFSFQNSGYIIGGVTVDPDKRFRYLKDIWIMKR